MNKIYKYFGIIVVTIVVFSCDHTKDVDYIPKDYAAAPSLGLTTSNNLATDGTTVLENSFRINFAPEADGVVYYAVFPAGTAAPDAEALIRKSSSALQKNDVSLTGQSNSIEIVASGIDPGYEYDVYAVMTSVDGIAGPVQMDSFTTPDETNPVFLGGNSLPAHDPAAGTLISPFLSSITLNFSERVYYQGGDILLEGFFTGVDIVLTAANFVTSTNGTKNLKFTIGDMLGIDDAIVVQFAAGTFADNVGLEGSGSPRFSYYFWTRPLTLAENVDLYMTGLYDYTIINELFVGIPVSPDGQYTVTQAIDDNDTPDDDTDDTVIGDQIVVLNAVATAVGRSNEHTLRFENNNDGDGVGFLFNVNDPQPSIYTFSGIRLYWHAYFNYLFTGVAGAYDFSTGEFFYLFDLAYETGFNGDLYLGWLEYNFTPAAAGRNAGRSQEEGLRNHPLVKKLFSDMEVLRGSMQTNINPLLYDDSKLSIN